MSPPLPILPGWWEDLQARYARPRRAYHTIEHVSAVLEHWRQVDDEGHWHDRSATWVAVLLHDVIYVPGAPDNEERSALLVPEWTRAFGVDVDVGAVQTLIRATADHGANLGAQGDLALFLDCDMAILGTPAQVYDRYIEQVRLEYADLVDEAGFRAGRRAFVAGLVGKPVFLSERFRNLYEERAQRNLRRELAHLC